MRWKRMNRLIQSEYALSVPRERWRRRATECTRSSSLGLLIDSGRRVKKLLS